MNPSSKLTLSLTSALLFFAIPATAGILLHSFDNDTYTPSFFYEGNTWTTRAAGDGFTITGRADLSPAGGMGQNIAPVDISSMTHLSLTLRLNPGNTATRLQVILRNQGTDKTHTYQFDLTPVKEGTFTTLSLSLANPLATAGGGVNFTALDRIQIQGTGNNALDSNFNITLQSVTAIPKPF